LEEKEGGLRARERERERGRETWKDKGMLKDVNKNDDHPSVY